VGRVSFPLFDIELASSAPPPKAATRTATVAATPERKNCSFDVMAFSESYTAERARADKVSFGKNSKTNHETHPSVGRDFATNWGFPA
jgi:hypothetical protein